MELVLEPDDKNKYNECKYKVKYWEHQFKKKNGRLPSKLDIREASYDIRQAYKTYFNLKSAALEASFQNIDGFDFVVDQENLYIPSNTSNISIDSNLMQSNNFNETFDGFKCIQDNISENSKVIADDAPRSKLHDSINSEMTWGGHLNNVEGNSVSKTNSFDANSCFTKKLFKNSNSSKRILRKSFSFNQRKSDTNLNVNGDGSYSLSQPCTSSLNASVTFCKSNVNETSKSSVVGTNNSNDILNVENLRIVKPVEAVKMNALNIVQVVSEEKFETVRQVDAGWMKRIAVSTGTKMINKNLNDSNFALSHQLHTSQVQQQDEDSDDIIGDSDEDDSKIHLSKKRRVIDTTLDFHPMSTVMSCENNNIDCVNTGIQGQSDTTQVVTSVSPIYLKAESGNTEKSEKRKTQQKESVPEQNFPRRKLRSKKKMLQVFSFNELQASEKLNVTGSGKDMDVSIYTETLGKKDYSSEIPSKKSSIQLKSINKLTLHSKEAIEEHEEESYALEFSIKPRRATVPRDFNVKNAIKKSRAQKNKMKDIKNEEARVKTKEEQKIEKFEQRIKSGNLNDNFVRINIEKKKYSRGKKSIKFSKYKRQQWKQKKKDSALYGPNMDMRGCDGGQLLCFNCGQIGHFAQKCPMEKGDTLLPLGANEESYCPYPTLDEASEMARTSELAVRKARREGEGKHDLNVADDVETQQSNDNQARNELEISDMIDESEDEYDNEIINMTDMFSDDDDVLLEETIKLEEFAKQVDAQQYIDFSRVVRPYYTTKENGDLIDTPPEVFDVLAMFGHSAFRDGQEKAIMRVLSGQSTLVTLSTGSGKSLCYQLPAYLLTKRESCITLVISPLVSLMEDQITGIPKFLRAECLHTNKTKLQRERILDAIATGTLHILLVSPEAVVAGEKQMGFSSLLRKLPPIAFACIDEAHCVSQWSHNFRPSYLMICSILKERLGVKTILGLTATATRATSDSIIRHLSISDGRNGVISDTPLPNNLRLTVSKDGNRDNALVNLILSDRFADLKSIIVYCTRRQECDRIASLLRTSLKNERVMVQEGDQSSKRKRKSLHVQAEPYHAGMAASKRRSIQNSFMRGDLRIVVATVAFGMGINKADIRAVVHYNLPKNFESYVQEVGRAGRDGLPAHCHLFLDAQGRDEDELQRHIFSDSLDRHVIRKLNSKIFLPCACKGVCPKHEVAFSIDQTVRALDIPEENIATLLCYLELHDKKYIEVLSPAYTTCKITAYGSANHIRKAAKDCPPLAMALAMFSHKDNDKENIFEFPVVDVAAAMGWDSGICKFKLKNLEWLTENGQPKRSLLTVQFNDLGFRLLAPGNLSNAQLDEVLDLLSARVQTQEQCALLQLRSLHETVTACAEATYRQCISKTGSEKEAILKNRIREYFDSAQPLSLYELKPKGCDEERVANDCRSMINMYRDNAFTGRALARIFYGIQSPNYPAVIWGRCKYWRTHINADFHKIVQIATREILKLK